MLPNINTFDILITSTYLEIEPAISQAVWRCSVVAAANDHWVSYWSSDTRTAGSTTNKHPSDESPETAKTTATTREPYNFTVELVDTKRIGFGTWTRNGDDKHPLYSYACWDFEPLKRPKERGKSGESGGTRIISDPTPKHQLRVYREAVTCYDDIIGHYFPDDRILAAYLVESSPHHYHVGIIFTQSLPKDAHDQIIATINLNRFKKTSTKTRAERSGASGTHYAPHSAGSTASGPNASNGMPGTRNNSSTEGLRYDLPDSARRSPTANRRTTPPSKTQPTPTPSSPGQSNTTLLPHAPVTTNNAPSSSAYSTAKSDRKSSGKSDLSG